MLQDPNAEVQRISLNLSSLDAGGQGLLQQSNLCRRNVAPLDQALDGFVRELLVGHKTLERGLKINDLISQGGMGLMQSNVLCTQLFKTARTCRAV